MKEELSKNAINLHPDSKIETNTKIGYGTNIRGPITIKGNEPCSIGKFCAIGDNIRIITVNHDVNRANNQVILNMKMGFKTFVDSRGPVSIGNNVWLGDTAIILSGVTVGDGACIGSGAVVTKDIPPFAIATGVPARITRLRFSEKIIEQLLNIKWWNWSIEQISRNKIFFELDLTLDPDINLSSIIVP